MSHSQRCLNSNRFGDGFDCLCDDEPLAKALRRVAELEQQLANRRERDDQARTDCESYKQKVADLEEIVKERDDQLLEVSLKLGPKIAGYQQIISDAAKLFERWLDRDGWSQGSDPLTDENRAWLARPEVIAARRYK